MNNLTLVQSIELTTNITPTNERIVGGVTPTNNTLVLLGAQTISGNNGLYRVNSTGAWAFLLPLTADILSNAYYVLLGNYANSVVQIQSIASANQYKISNSFGNLLGNIDITQLPNGGVNNANQLVQLSGSTKLPAVDGSQLTSLSGALSSSVNSLTVAINGGTASSPATIINSNSLSLSGTSLSSSVNGVTSGTVSIQPLITLPVANNVVTMNSSGQVIDSTFSINNINSFAAPSSLQLTDTQSIYNFVTSIASSGNGLRPVMLCFTTNQTLSGLPTQGGYTCVNGDRVICTGQTNTAENLVYNVHSGAWTVASDSDEVAKLLGAWVSIIQGTYSNFYVYIISIIPSSGFVTPTSVVWSVPMQQDLWQAGTGLNLTGSVFSIANTTVTNGSYSVAGKGLFTVNPQGQLTNAANVTIATTDLSNVSATSAIDAQLLISNGTSYTPRSLSGAITINNIGVTTLGSNVIANSNLAVMPANTIKGNNTDSSATPNDLTVAQVLIMFSSQSPIFASLNLTNNTSQIVLGITNKTTITMATLTGNRIFTLPNANSNSVQPLVSATTNQWVAFIDSNGVQNLLQPATTSLSDVSATSATNAQVLISNGTSYTPRSLSGAITISNLGVTTLGSNVVANSNLATMAANTLKGNNTGSSATPLDLTVAQVLAMFSGSTASFTSLALTNNTNQLTLGTTNTTTITMATLTGNRIFTLPNAKSNPVQPLVSATANNWVQYIDDTGVQNLARPAFTDISGTLGLSAGGTNANLTASNGQVVYSTASALALTTGTLNTNSPLVAKLGGVPMWSDIALPSSLSINQIVYASANNVMSGVPIANNRVLITNGSGVPFLSTTLPQLDSPVNIREVTQVNGGTVNLQSNTGSAQASSSNLGSVIFSGSTNGTTMADSGRIRAVAAQTWSNSARGAKLEFAIVPNNTTALTTALTINEDSAVIASKYILTNNGTAGFGNTHLYFATVGTIRTGFALFGEETGSNAGANMGISSYADNGSFLYTYIFFMRNTSQILIGNWYPISSQSAKVQIITGGNVGIVFAPASNVSFTPISFRNNSDGSIGSISCTTTNTAYNTTSDYRLKDNVVNYTGALDALDKLRPVKYTWKSDNSQGEGFIAHELQGVLPCAVTGEKDATEIVTEVARKKELYLNGIFIKAQQEQFIGTVIREEFEREAKEEIDGIEYDVKTYLIHYAKDINNIREVHQQVDYSKVVPLLTAALKELTEEIKQLKEQIKELQSD